MGSEVGIEREDGRLRWNEIIQACVLGVKIGENLMKSFNLEFWSHALKVGT